MLDSLPDPTLAAACLAAVVLAGLSKGGLSGIGTLSTPILALVMPPVQAAAVMLPILIMQDTVGLFAYRRTVDWTLIRGIVPGAVLGIFLAYLLAAHLAEGAVSLAIGIVAICFAGLNVARRNVAIRAAPGALAGWFWGVVAGFASTVAHAGGPPFQIYALRRRLPRDLFVGSSIVFFATINWIKVAPFVALGQLTWPSLRVSLLLAPVAVASTFAGIWIVRRIDPERFFVIIHLLLAAVGVKLVADGAAGLM